MQGMKRKKKEPLKDVRGTYFPYTARRRNPPRKAKKGREDGRVVVDRYKGTRGGGIQEQDMRVYEGDGDLQSGMSKLWGKSQ